jgi:hypothetical protein
MSPLSLATTTLALALMTCPLTIAFAPVPTTTSAAALGSCLQATRRDSLAFCFAALVVVPTTARADLNFENVQDLLKDNKQSQEEYIPASARPKYLTEPTDEFKENERVSMAFKREQLQRKKEFQRVLDKLQDDPPDAAVMADDLEELRRLVRAGYGLPQGINKQDVVKQVRLKKAKKFWPTIVEIG